LNVGKAHKLSTKFPGWSLDLARASLWGAPTRTRGKRGASQYLSSVKIPAMSNGNLHSLPLSFHIYIYCMLRLYAYLSSLAC
jgi:hypothetical protein